MIEYIYIFKAKERKQYQKNCAENLFVVIIYLMEALKMRLQRSQFHYRNS